MDWIDKGLHFDCGRCGNCCTGDPGYVWCTPGELEQLAAAIGTDLDTFCRDNVRRIGNAFSLRETADGACVLWDADRGCRAYEARPVQCRTWPFWPELVQSRESWETAAGDCLGMRRGLAGNGTFHPLNKIRSEVAHAAANDPLNE